MMDKTKKEIAHEQIKIKMDALHAVPSDPVAWLLTEEDINHLQVESVQRLIDRAKHAHHVDILMRINGQDERYEADWLKHLMRAQPQQVSRDDVLEEAAKICEETDIVTRHSDGQEYCERTLWNAAEAIRALKSKENQRNISSLSSTLAMEKMVKILTLGT